MTMLILKGEVCFFGRDGCFAQFKMENAKWGRDDIGLQELWSCARFKMKNSKCKMGA
jgi:hypothetical protein